MIITRLLTVAKYNNKSKLQKHLIMMASDYYVHSSLLKSGKAYNTSVSNEVQLEHFQLSRTNVICMSSYNFAICKFDFVGFPSANTNYSFSTLTLLELHLLLCEVLVYTEKENVTV